MTRERRLSTSARLGIVLLTCMGMRMAGAADARLEVQVLDQRSGTPLEGVGVCLGTAAEPAQIDSQKTDAGGRAVFRSIPASSLQLLLSRAGYIAQTRPVESIHGNSTLVLKLAPGWQAGPRCVVSERVIPGGEGGLVITGLDLKRDSAQSGAVRIGVRVRGTPDQIRVSEREDFHDAQWQPYRAEIPLVLSVGNERKTLFVQVRRAAGLDGATIQALSPVKSVSVNAP